MFTIYIRTNYTYSNSTLPIAIKTKARVYFRTTTTLGLQTSVETDQKRTIQYVQAKWHNDYVTEWHYDHVAESLLRDKVARLFMNLPTYYGTRSSLPCSQETITGSYPQQLHRVHNLQPYFFKINLISSHLSLGLERGLFTSHFPTYILYAIILSQACQVPLPHNYKPATTNIATVPNSELTGLCDKFKIYKICT
jgi:hypothetical protein